MERKGRNFKYAAVSFQKFKWVIKDIDSVETTDTFAYLYSEDTGTAHFSAWSGDTMYYSDGIVTGPHKPIYIEFLEFLDD